jgi:hypothetical protein
MKPVFGLRNPKINKIMSKSPGEVYNCGPKAPIRQVQENKSSLLLFSKKKNLLFLKKKKQKDF